MHETTCKFYNTKNAKDESRCVFICLLQIKHSKLYLTQKGNLKYLTSFVFWLTTLDTTIMFYKSKV